MEAMTGRPFLTVPRFDRVPRLVHGFGTAGFPQAEFVRWAAALGFRPVIMEQVHSDAIHRVRAVPRRKLRGDGLVTDVPGLLLVVRTADCLPALLVDRAAGAVAAVHCGWRGTRKRILARAVEAMASEFGARPDRLLAALGPCIGTECYEVGEDVRRAFQEDGFPAEIFHPIPKTPSKSLLDLRVADAFVLREAGVPPDRVFSIEACTRCDSGLLSYRRDRDREGRMMNFIGLRGR